MEVSSGYGKSELNVEKKRRALSEAAERRELCMDYRASPQHGTYTLASASSLVYFAFDVALGFVKTEQDKAKRVQIAQFEEQKLGKEPCELLVCTQVL